MTDTTQPELTDAQRPAVIEQPPTQEPKQPASIVKAGERGLHFSTMGEMWKFCVAVASSGEFKSVTSPEVALVRIQAGLELGLSPIWSLANIMVQNGIPSVFGDALLGIVLSQPDCEDVIETVEHEGTDKETAVCEVRRKGRAPVIRKFSIQDAIVAGIHGKNVHKVYPARMRQMRARSWACRDAFADALRGLTTREEMDSIPQAKARAVEADSTLRFPDEQ